MPITAKNRVREIGCLDMTKAAYFIIKLETIEHNHLAINKYYLVNVKFYSNQQKRCLNGIDIFYREAGDRKNPTLLLLHGFPARRLCSKHRLKKLSGDFHLIAPDYPGFGFSGFPDTDSFKYTFDNIAACIDSFLQSIDVNDFFIYLHDYGSAIGLRICMKHLDRILGIIVQNGNAYMEGLARNGMKPGTIGQTQHRKKRKKSKLF